MSETNTEETAIDWESYFPNKKEEIQNQFSESVSEFLDDDNVDKAVSATTAGKVEYGYREATPSPLAGTNPCANGWYVKVRFLGISSAKSVFVKTKDTTPQSGTTYYIRYVKPVDQETTSTGTKGRTDVTALKNRKLLLEEALDYIAHHYKPDSFTITVTALDLHLLDSNVSTIQIGDIGNVVYDRDGNSKRGTCYAIKYDLSNPEKNQYTIGDPEVAFSN